MVTITEEQLRENLASYIDEMLHGQEVMLIRDNTPLAVVKAEQPKTKRSPRMPGSAKGLIGPVPDDFDDPLEDFKDYM